MSSSAGRCSEPQRVAVDLASDGGEPLWSMPDGVHCRRDGQEDLSGADVAGGLVAANVLLAGLHGHAQRAVSVGVDAHPDDATRDPAYLKGFETPKGKGRTKSLYEMEFYGKGAGPSRSSTNFMDMLATALPGVADSAKAFFEALKKKESTPEKQPPPDAPDMAAMKEAQIENLALKLLKAHCKIPEMEDMARMNEAREPPRLFAAHHLNHRDLDHAVVLRVEARGLHVDHGQGSLKPTYSVAHGRLLF